MAIESETVLAKDGDGGTRHAAVTEDHKRLDRMYAGHRKT